MKKIISILISCIVLMCSCVSCGIDIDYKNESNSLIGKSNVSSEGLIDIIKNSIDLSDTSIIKYNDAVMIFNTDGTMNLHMSFDFSKIIYLHDDKMYFAGQELDVMGYDGKSLDIEVGGMLGMRFEKKMKSPTRYGTYSIPEEAGFGLKDRDEASIIFLPKGHTYLELDSIGTYTYDREAGTISIQYKNSERSNLLTNVEINGRKLTCNESGQDITLTKKISVSFDGE